MNSEEHGCPICKSKKSVVIITRIVRNKYPEVYNDFRCKDCGHIWTERGTTAVRQKLD